MKEEYDTEEEAADDGGTSNENEDEKEEKHDDNESDGSGTEIIPTNESVQRNISSSDDEDESEEYVEEINQSETMDSAINEIHRHKNRLKSKYLTVIPVIKVDYDGNIEEE